MDNKIRLIRQGWYNLLVEDKEVEILAKERAKICSECPFAKHGNLLTFVKDKLTEVQGMYCSKCKCPLSAKIRSEDSCPIQKW